MTNYSVKVSENKENLKHIVSNLKVGDLVSFTVLTRITEGQEAEMEVFYGELLAIVYGFESRYPMLTFLDQEGDEWELSSVRLTSVEPKGTKSTVVFYPETPSSNLYFQNNFIVQVLQNKYGHLPYWKDTLYDIASIQRILRDKGYRMRGKTDFNRKKAKAVILQVAPRLKVTRKRHRSDCRFEYANQQFDNSSYSRG